MRRLLVAAVAAALVAVPGTTAYAGTPSPGGRILYVAVDDAAGGPGNIKSMQPNGQNVQDTGKSVYWFSSPDYSPDGSQIAYVDGFSIRAMASDGTNDRWLVDGGSAPAYPRWSPDGQWIVAESGGDIWQVSKDGFEGGWSDLTGTHDSNDLVPSWGPKGHRFAAATFNDVRIYSADGSRLRKIIPLEGAYRLDWNPKGDQLVVEAQGDLWLVDVGSGAVQRLTNTPNDQELSPVWSPDGNWLTYGRGPGVYDPNVPGSGVSPVIWLMDRSGGHSHSLDTPGIPSSWRSQT
jgi:TolB protein